jgi:DNA-directed RNA polymerase specialized sigma24 family protein
VRAVIPTWEEVKKRAAGRQKYNALQQLRAAVRRREVLTLLGELGWTYGSQAAIARQLGVSEATISRDLAKILPLMQECATCGGLTPRDWWREG